MCQDGVAFSPSLPSASLPPDKSACLFPSKKDPSSAPLGNSGSLQADLADQTRRKRRNERYKLLGLLSKQLWAGALPKHQARFCSAKAVPDTVKKKDGTKVETGMPGSVQIHRTEDKHHYYGLGRCASALVCPVCSMIIQARRAEEVVTAGSYLLAHGFKIGMVTQTASHREHTSLYDFVQRFQAAQRDMKGTREYQAWQKRHGMKYTIRAVEVTDDNPEFDFAGEGKRRSGWHFHSHTILFFERATHFTDEEVTAFSEEFQKLWVRALAGVGLSGSRERAAVFSVPEGVSEADGQAALSKYVAKGIGYEVSGGRMKSGRDGDRRISSWKLQELALTTRPDMLPRYADYMGAVKGLNWLRWSPGLKRFCGIDELTDEDVMRGDSGEEMVWDFEADSFFGIVRQAAQGRLLDIADKEGKPGIARAIRASKMGCDVDTGEVLPGLDNCRCASIRKLDEAGIWREGQRITDVGNVNAHGPACLCADVGGGSLKADKLALEVGPLCAETGS